MIITLCILAYLVIAVAVTRPLYGHYRATAIRINDRTYFGDPVDRFNAQDRTGEMIAAAIAGLFWPIPALYYSVKPIVLLAGRAFVLWVGTSKTRSAYEIRQAEERRKIEQAEREAKLRARIAELERINGLT